MKNDALGRLHSSGQLHRSVHRWAWIERFPSVSNWLRDAEIGDDHAEALAVWLGLGALLLTATWFELGVVWAIGVLAVLSWAPVAVVSLRAGRRPRRVLALMPDTIDMIGRSLRSGATLRTALTEVSEHAPQPMRDELRPVVQAIARGQALPDALRAWADRSSIPEIRIVAAALSFASANEAGTLQGLEGVAQSLRDRAVVKAEIKSLTAQASVSMQALVLLPVGFLTIDYVGSRRAVHFLLHEPTGRLCLAAGVLLNLTGWLWMQRLIRRRSPT